MVKDFLDGVIRHYGDGHYEADTTLSVDLLIFPTFSSYKVTAITAGSRDYSREKVVEAVLFIRNKTRLRKALNDWLAGLVESGILTEESR